MLKDGHKMTLWSDSLESAVFIIYSILHVTPWLSNILLSQRWHRHWPRSHSQAPYQSFERRTQLRKCMRFSLPSLIIWEHMPSEHLTVPTCCIQSSCLSVGIHISLDNFHTTRPWSEIHVYSTSTDGESELTQALSNSVLLEWQGASKLSSQ